MPKKICRLLQALYAGTKSAVREDGELNDWFDVNTGLRQGCLLSPALFNVYIDHVLRRTLDEVEKEERAIWGDGLESRRSGVRFEYRMPDGRRVRGDLTEGKDRVLALLYADDLALLAEDEGSLRRLVMSFERVTQESGLTINVAKTKQLITLSDRKDPKDRLIDVDLSIRGEKVERVKEFVYLCSVVSETGSSIHDINR